MERTLIEAAPALEEQLGRRSAMTRTLQQLKRALSNQLALDRALEQLAERLLSPENRAFIRTLPYLRQFGAKPELYVRQSHRALAARMMLEKEVRSEQHGKHLEALIMMLLPFGAALFMQVGGGQEQANWASNGAAFWIDLLLYGLSWLAVFLCLLLLKRGERRTGKIPQPPLPRRLPAFCYDLADRWLSHDPLALAYRLAAACRKLCPEDEANAWPAFVCKVLISFVPLGLLGLAAAFRSPAELWPFLLPALLLAAYPFQELALAEKQLQRQVRLLYPDFLALMSILLDSGLSLASALELSLKRLSEKNLLKRDLELVAHDMQRGHSAGRALRNLAKRLPQSEFAACLQLMARYEREGSRELLRLIELQAEQSRQIYRQAFRAHLEAKNVLLLFPMVFDLLLVLLISLLPALSSLQQL